MKHTSKLILSVAAFFILAVNAVSAAAQGQSGYWAQVVARDATLRERPGGKVLKTLTHGQWVHLYPSYKNPSWFMGYACPNGNRGCSNQQSIPGFILRSAVSARAAISSPSLPGTVGEASFVTVKAETNSSSFAGGARYVPALYSPAEEFTAAATITALPGQERRICAREVWMRNDKLWPIELLHAGDNFIVERYTDGSQNNGQARWAIGRAKNLRGRVLVSALCR